MKFLQMIYEWLFKKQWFSKRFQAWSDQAAIEEGKTPVERALCSHPRVRHPCTLTILGVEVKFTELPTCLACAEAYLNKFSTLCGFCLNPILPGQAIGGARSNAPHPFTHLSSKCSDGAGGLYCGNWGEGHHIPLHIIDPKQFPPPTEEELERHKGGGFTVIAKFP